ncbi:craniofacial development protein 2-like [Octopus bimaculoides]|uniref:craniofacial development protein 2-like n=1 Tax=Octopus bimaculoides TaxID=37653 RepID=UPI00071D411F|nr:craniofacial development protein 2-like [Octopus bimaculoides]|eukprot:XP_014768234.1 PREDICTED: craniofacial development protein 2-like [Octopus bimaculoides]
MNSNEVVKKQFYSELRSQLRGVSIHVRPPLGNFNARVGYDTSIWYDVIGKHGVDKANLNGRLLLSLCCEYGILIINTIFQLPNHHKTTWKHLRCNQYHFTDYIIVRSSMREDVQVTRSLSIGERRSDHRLIRSKVNFTIRNPIRNNHTRSIRKVDVRKLRNNDNLSSFQTTCDDKPAGILDNTDIESAWSAFKNTVFELFCEILGFLEAKQIITVKVHCNQLAEMHAHLQKLRSALERHLAIMTPVFVRIIDLASIFKVLSRTIKRIVNRFKKEEIVERKTGSGGHNRKRDHHLNLELKRSIRRDPTQSIRRLAHKREVSAMKVSRTVTEDLEMKS